MFVEAGRQQDPRVQKHVAPPECRELGGAQVNETQELLGAWILGEQRIGSGNGRDDFVEAGPDGR
jgi:hypothetical protein